MTDVCGGGGRGGGADGELLWRRPRRRPRRGRDDEEAGAVWSIWRAVEEESAGEEVGDEGSSF